jgi:hypothetical protein
MTLIIPVVIVLAQIAVFQFLAAWANRSVLLQEISRMTGSVPDSVAAHTVRAPIRRMGIGGVLAAVLVLVLSGQFNNPSMAKGLIAAVSVVSAVAFAISQSTDRRVMRTLAESAPDGSVKFASLQKRDLGKWYRSAFEVIPALICVATIVFLIGTAGSSLPWVGTGEQTRILVYLGLQVATVIWGIFRNLKPVVGVPSVAPYIPSLRRNPAVSVRLGEDLAVTQLRFALIAKIGITALLGASVVKRVLLASGNPAAAVWGIAAWCILGVLLVLYVQYFRQIGRISRKINEQMN